MEARRIYRSADYVIRGWVGLTIVRNRVPGDHDRTDDIDESEKSFVLRPTISSHSFRSLEEITRIFLAMRQRNGRNGEDLPSNGSFRSNPFRLNRRVDGFGIRRLHGVRLLRGAGRDRSRVQSGKYVSEER